MIENGRIRIDTPDGVQFWYTLASPATRLFAVVIDFFVINAVVLAAGSSVSAILSLSPGIISALFIILAFVVTVGYSMILEWFLKGQTVGKRVLRIKVMDAGGLALSLPQVVLRNIIRIIDILPSLNVVIGGYFVGGLSMVLSQRHRRLGDIAANTIVVRIPKLRESVDVVLEHPKYNSFREHQLIIARVKKQVPAEIAVIARNAVRRRDELDDAARLAVFSEMAAYFKEVAGFPEEACFGLPDEQYVRNMVDVLFEQPE